MRDIRREIDRARGLRGIDDSQAPTGRARAASAPRSLRCPLAVWMTLTATRRVRASTHGATLSASMPPSRNGTCRI